MHGVGNLTRAAYATQRRFDIITVGKESMTRTIEMPERICRRVERRIASAGYTLPMLTAKLYSIWLDGGIELDDDRRTVPLSSEYTDIFGIVKDDIDPAAPHDMPSIRANIARRRKDYKR